MAENTRVLFSQFSSGSTAGSFRLAAEYLRNHPGTDLVIEPGEYLITDHMAVSAQESVMNGEWGSNPQRVMFNPEYRYFIGIPLHNITNCSVIADNVKLIIDGFMEPVSVKGCTDFTVRGFEIVHRRRPFSRGTVTDVLEAECCIKFDEDCPITPKTPMLLRSFFCYEEDGKKHLKDIESWEYIDSLHIKLHTKYSFGKIEKGMKFYTAHTYHSRPAVLIENSENIVLDGMVIRNQPGMGIVGNRCENVFIRNLKVIPEEGYSFSTNTDATHFTSMKGKLYLENCTADSQGDDFTNVHTYYQIIAEKLGDKTYKIRENTPDGTHSQSIDYPDPGDTLELSEHRTLRCIGEYKVENTEILYSENCCIVTLDRPLPKKTAGLVISDITRLPELRITGCSCINHYARGVLIKCRNAHISGNMFRGIMGPAIEIAAEAAWYEGIVPSHVHISDNTVVNCATEWGEAAGIVVKTDCSDPKYQTIYDISVENNRIDSAESRHGIYCRNVDGLKLSGNIINCTDELEVIENCANIQQIM